MSGSYQRNVTRGGFQTIDTKTTAFRGVDGSHSDRFSLSDWQNSGAMHSRMNRTMRMSSKDNHGSKGVGQSGAVSQLQKLRCSNRASKVKNLQKSRIGT